MKKVTIAIILLLFCIQVSYAQDYDHFVYLPIIQANRCEVPMYDNKWRLITPVESSNYVLNPSAETTGNFTAFGGGTMTRVTTYQHYGLYSYRIQTVAPGDGGAVTLQALDNAIHYVTFRVRGTWPSVLNIVIDTVTPHPPTFIEAVNSDWNLYGYLFSASEANGSVSFAIAQVAAGSADIYIDGIQIEPLNYWTTYIDGTQPGCEWLGATHGSRSRRSGESRAGGKSVDFYEEYGFFIQKVVGAGSASKTLGVDSYALLPGGELNSVKVNTRDWTIVGTFYADSEKKLHENIQALDTILQNSSYVGSQPYLIRFNGAKVQKEIASHYRGGLEGDLPAYYEECYRQDGDKWIKVLEWTTDASIQMQSPNPYWYEVGESAALLDTNDSATFRVVAARLRDTGQWDELGPPNAAGTYTQIYAIEEDDTYVYFGGNFLNFDNIANADQIVRYNKQTGVYTDIGVSNGLVRDLLIGPDGVLYACGLFTVIGGVAANRIAYWDGAAWNALGAGVDSSAYSMVFGLDGTLYVAGAFVNAGGNPASRIASWDGAAWSALGAGADNSVFAVDIHPDSTLYIAGDFANAGGNPAVRIASWDGTAWSALESNGLNAAASSLAIDSDGIIYIAGNFTTAGAITVNYIAKWNGQEWTDLNGGMDAAVYTLEIGPDDVLYASGSFTMAGDIDLADGLARWNGSTWAHMGIDLPGAVLVRGLLASASDPVVPNNYDIWVGWDTTGTGYFGGLVTVDNEGSVPAYPTIYFNRSGGTSAVIQTLRNERTGRELLFNYSLLDGETLTINLAPTEKSIVSSFFSRKRPDAILANSDFGSWVLKPNDNDVTSFVNVAGAPTVTAWLLWRDGYDGYN